MADIVSTEVRSRMMASIRGRDTKPEIAVRRHLHAHGFRFRLHRKELAGKPDLILPKWKVAVFVHGCFWHKHAGCKYFRLPTTRPEFWSAKIDSNVRRDLSNQETLQAAGWRIAQDISAMQTIAMALIRAMRACENVQHENACSPHSQLSGWIELLSRCVPHHADDNAAALAESYRFARRRIMQNAEATADALRCWQPL